MTDFDDFENRQTGAKVEGVQAKVEEIVAAAEPVDARAPQAPAAYSYSYQPNAPQQPVQPPRAPQPPSYSYGQARQQQAYGQRSVPQPPAQPYYPPVGYMQRSRLIAALLGIFLGALGIHSFYLGNSTKGVIQIVVTLVTCGFGSIWGFVEGILIICGNVNYDANGVPLKETI